MSAGPQGVRKKLTDPEATRRAALALAALLQPGDVIGLVGDLGAGKTFFVQALAEGLDVPREVRVTSPTFTLINEYLGGRLPLYHADLYRIEEEGELDELGLDDVIRGDGAVAVEWSDRFEVLPKAHVRIELTVVGETARELALSGQGGRGAALAAAWARAL
jgi:tRNA threonylcarbamoyladenosine biosynthesis protein TsaE